MLGASLHGILTRLKAQPHLYPNVDISYSSTKPLHDPVILTLPYNGLRLRFDGPDQRLRLIEILEFSKIALSYKNVDLVKLSETQDGSLQGLESSRLAGPAFRQVYNKLFGPTFPGEYQFPLFSSSDSYGTYVLSYPGLAFSFPLRDSAWSSSLDFVSLLSSSAAQPASCMTIFNGSSWANARQDLYIRSCPNPRSLALTGRGRDGVPDEIELVRVCGGGLVEFVRRSSSQFRVVLSETTPQDLVAELGPPDAIYRKNDQRLSIHKPRTESHSHQHQHYSSSPGQTDDLTDTDRSPAHTNTDDSDIEDGSVPEYQRGDVEASAECFFNYFHHGFDIFISNPTLPSPEWCQSRISHTASSSEIYADRLVATKILLHANVPGSYPFNRYRRCRWIIEAEEQDVELSSETPFTILSQSLRAISKGSYASEEEEKLLQRGMVLNRGWGDSPGSSCELLGGWEESADSSKDGHSNPTTNNSSSVLGNTELFGFPGLLFEVLKNDAVSCLTVY